MGCRRRSAIDRLRFVAAEPRPLWSALLVLAYFPMLKRLREVAATLQLRPPFGPH